MLNSVKSLREIKIYSSSPTIQVHSSLEPLEYNQDQTSFTSLEVPGILGDLKLVPEGKAGK